MKGGVDEVVCWLKQVAQSSEPQHKAGGLDATRGLGIDPRPSIVWEQVGGDCEILAGPVMALIPGSVDATVV